MKQSEREIIQDVALPWSDGSLSAKLWKRNKKIVAGVPELGIYCYGSTQSEVIFRLFSSLLKYYQQLKADQHKLEERGKEHFQLLSGWVRSVEQKMVDRASVR